MFLSPPVISKKNQILSNKKSSTNSKKKNNKVVSEEDSYSSSFNQSPSEHMRVSIRNETNQKNIYQYITLGDGEEEKRILGVKVLKLIIFAIKYFFPSLLYNVIHVYIFYE